MKVDFNKTGYLPLFLSTQATLWTSDRIINQIISKGRYVLNFIFPTFEHCFIWLFNAVGQEKMIIVSFTDSFLQVLVCGNSSETLFLCDLKQCSPALFAKVYLSHALLEIYEMLQLTGFTSYHMLILCIKYYTYIIIIILFWNLQVKKF